MDDIIQPPMDVQQYPPLPVDGGEPNGGEPTDDEGGDAMNTDEPNGGEGQVHGIIEGITQGRSLRSTNDPETVAFWTVQSKTLGKRVQQKAHPKPSDGDGKGNGQGEKTAAEGRDFTRPSLPAKLSARRELQTKSQAPRSCGDNDSGSSTDGDYNRRGRGSSHWRGGYQDERSRSPARRSTANDHDNLVARMREWEDKIRILEGKVSSLKKENERLTADNKALQKDAEFLREKNVHYTGRSFQVALGSAEEGSDTTFMDIMNVDPMGEPEALLYKRLGDVPPYVTVMSASMLATLSVNSKTSERKMIASRTAALEYNYNRGDDYDAALHDVMAVVTYPVIITSSAEGGYKEYGITNLVGIVVPDQMLTDNGAPNVQFVTGNLQAALRSADPRKAGGLFSRDRDYEWTVSFSDLGVEDYINNELKNPTSAVPMFHKMFVAAGNKPTLAYSMLQLQDEAGGEGGGVREKSLKSKDIDSTQIKNISAVLGKKPESVKDLRQYMKVLTIGKKIGSSGEQQDSCNDAYDEYPILSSKKVSKGTTPAGPKKSFYTEHTETFQEVCASSKWSANGHLLVGATVKFAGETYPLDVGLSTIIAEGIPIVAPDAPFRAGQDTRGDKGPRVLDKFSTKPWPSTCNFALLADMVKGMAAEVIPGFRSNQNVNHEEGKQLFMAIMKSGFGKASDGSESEGKQWLVDHNISPSDPLALNMALALLASRFNTEQHQADILRNFQGGEQGDERLATYFDSMLASAKGAHATMSYQQQANTIRAGMRKSRVKAQLLGKPIPKMTSYEELVTLVKHTWLPEAVNHGEDGPMVPYTPKKTAAASAKKAVDPSKKVCPTCKKIGHTEDYCYFKYPERRPKSEPTGKAEGKSIEGTQSKESIDGKAGESSKKGDSSNTGNGKEGAGIGKDSGATSKPAKK